MVGLDTLFTEVEEFEMTIKYLQVRRNFQLLLFKRTSVLWCLLLRLSCYDVIF